MDNVFHASLFGDVQKVFALAHHVDCVAGGEKGPINALDRRRDGLGLVEVETTGTPRSFAFSGERAAAISSTLSLVMRCEITFLPTWPVARSTRIFGLFFGILVLF